MGEVDTESYYTEK